jgi:hypothetical protein
MLYTPIHSISYNTKNSKYFHHRTIKRAIILNVAAYCMQLASKFSTKDGIKRYFNALFFVADPQNACKNSFTLLCGACFVVMKIFGQKPASFAIV